MAESTQTWTDWIALRGEETMSTSAVVEVLEDVVAALDTTPPKA